MCLACRRVWRFPAKLRLHRAAAARRRRSSSIFANGDLAAVTTRTRSRACCARRPSSTHRHATSSASTRKLSTLELHFHTSWADKMRAKRACLHTRHKHRSSAPASQTTARTRRAHSQHTHDAHTSPLPLASTAKMQFGAACRRMCSQHALTALTYDGLAARARACGTAVPEHANRGGLEVSIQNFSVQTSWKAVYGQFLAE